MLQEKVQSLTGICSEAQQLLVRGRHVPPDCAVSSIGHEATVWMVVEGRGGMSASAESCTLMNAAFEDLGIFQRCMHRVHRFSPGVEGREMLRDGDRCASLGHWSLLLGHVGHRIHPSTVTAQSLHAACRGGRLDAMELLMRDYGVDVNGCGLGGWTALHTAMAVGDEALVRYLLSVGGEDVATEEGVRACALRPELWTRVTGKAGVVDSWEVPEGAESAANKLVGMIAEGNVSTDVLCRRVCAAVEMLGCRALRAEGTEIRTIGHMWVDKWTVLTASAALGSLSLCSVCLDLEAGVDEVGNGGGAPLHNACEEGHTDCARLFLDRGAEVDQVDSNNETPFHRACRNGHVDCARVLLDHGAEVDRADSLSETPLHGACCEGHIKCARLLLDRGARVDHANTGGWMPLHRASFYNLRHVAQLLLERGADPATRADDGESAADKARCEVFPGADHDLAETMELATRDRAAAIEKLRGMDAVGP